MKIGLPYFCLGLLLFVLCTGCRNQIQPSKSIAYSFFVAGHTYGNPTYYQFGLHPPLMNHLSTINAYPAMRLGILTGDVVPKATTDYWDAAQRDMAKFDVPIHIAAGNHDRGEEFEKRFKKYYYAFKQQEDLFIILSPTNWNIEGEQLEFLNATLSANTSSTNNIFIFLHELVWWAPDNKFGNIEINYRPHYPGMTNFWEELFPLFDELSNNVILFAGDIGATEIVSPYMYYQQGNVTLLANGMGGGKEDNIIILDVNNEGKITYKLFGLNRENLYEMAHLKKFELP